VVEIGVNWSSAEAAPDLSAYWSRNRHQRLMAVAGQRARASVLVVPALTSAPLAVVVMRLAAGLSVAPAHQDTQVFDTAIGIVHAAREAATKCRPEGTHLHIDQ
jgi:hypothetical protein